MSTAYPIIVAVHGSVGVVALISFWGAALLRKGSPMHRFAGRAFLLAMVGIIATALPMAAQKLAQGQPVVAAFLAYLVVLTSAGVWAAWRSIRDKHDVAAYTGTVYAALAWLNLLAGVAVLLLGIRIGSPLLMGFSVVGLFAGQDMLRKRRHRDRLAAQPRWWLVEHYSAMLGNGIATHVAFLAIGLPRLLPAIDGAALHYLAWFGPLVVALFAKLLVDRRWKPQPRPAMAAPPARNPAPV